MNVSDEAKEFSRKFMQAIPAGADLSLVAPKFLVWLLDREYKDKKDQEMVSEIVQMCKDQINGKDVSEDWAEFAPDLRGAYTDSWVNVEGWPDWMGIEDWAVNWIAWNTHRNDEATRTAEYQRMADKLIELVREAQ